MSIKIPVSPGELLDKITILKIKASRIVDQEKNANVRFELKLLTGEWYAAIAKQPDDVKDQLEKLEEQLVLVNTRLWAIEDDLRVAEGLQQFGEKFIRDARAVYINNDYRFELKQLVNKLLDSCIVEEKQLPKYARSPESADEHRSEGQT